MNPEIIIVDDKCDGVSCDGGGGPLGHPKVWYTLTDDYADCGYCDRLFIKKSAQKRVMKALKLAA